MEYGYKPTTNGRALITKCMALEKPLILTRVAFGSGLIAEDVNLADVHELVSYVVDGAIGERIHKDDRLHLTVQYDNSAHPDTPTFYLNEFIVYGQDPETSEDVDLLYATLGDYKQPVPAYSSALPPSVWKFPLTLIVSDEVNVEVTAAAGLVTYDDLNEAVEAACKTLIDSMATGGIKKTVEFTMAPDDWQEDAAATNGYGFYYDLTDSDITKNMVPDVTIAEDSLLVAALAGMCVTATTYAGYVRLKCVVRPENDISASCNLLVRGEAGTGGTSIIGLPPASATTLGGVIVEEGSGLKIDEDGRLSVDVATDDEVSDAIDDTLGEGASDSDTPSEEEPTTPGNMEVATDNEVSDVITDIFGEEP